jgi:hypothetical protein
MAHSPKQHCGMCGVQYEPSRGGWSHGRTVQQHHPGLRVDAREGDPLHDACYKTIYRMMVRAFFDPIAC